MPLGLILVRPVPPSREVKASSIGRRYSEKAKCSPLELGQYWFRGPPSTFSDRTAAIAVPLSSIVNTSAVARAIRRIVAPPAGEVYSKRNGPSSGNRSRGRRDVKVQHNRGR